MPGPAGDIPNNFPFFYSKIIFRPVKSHSKKVHELNIDKLFALDGLFLSQQYHDLSLYSLHKLLSNQPPSVR